MTSFGEIARLRAALNDKEAALAEVVDEIVYFENKLKAEERKSKSIQECMSSSNGSHSDAIAALLKYVFTLEEFVDPTPEVLEKRESMFQTLKSTAETQGKCSETMSTLSDSSVQNGWGREGLEQIEHQMTTFQNQQASVHVRRSGSIVVQSRGSPRRSGDTRSSPSVVTTPGIGSPSGMSTRRVNISRSGSVLVEKYQDSPNVTHGQVQGLRNRISELEGELADIRVKLGVSERSRLSAVRDRDAMSKELEVVSQEKETMEQSLKSQVQEASTAREETQDAIRDRESLERRIESLEAQLREAWAARDSAVAESKHAGRDMKESERAEMEAVRSRDKAYAELETAVEEQRRLSEKVEKLQRDYDSAARQADDLSSSSKDFKAKMERLTLERNTARAERDASQIDAENAKQKVNAAEMEKKYALDDVAEAIRQRDAAQQQAVAAIEEEENAIKQKQQALANSVKAQESAEAAVRARKDAEATARKSMGEAENLRIEVMHERRQKEAIMKEMKQALQERQNAIVELKIRSQEDKSEDAHRAKINTEIAELKSTKNMADELATEMKGKCARLESELESERERLHQASATERALLTQIKELNETLRRKESASAQDKGRDDTLQRDLEQFKGGYYRLSENVRVLEQQLAESIDKYRSLQMAFQDAKVSLRQQQLVNEQQATLAVSRQQLSAESPPQQRARVHVRRSGSVVIQDNAGAVRLAAGQSFQASQSSNSRVIHIDRAGKMSHVQRRTENGMGNSAAPAGPAPVASAGAATTRDLGSLKVQVQRMKEQAADAAQRAREDVSAVEVAAAGMKEKLRMLEEERKGHTEENARLKGRVSDLEKDLGNAKQKYDLLEQKYDGISKLHKEAGEKIKSLDGDISGERERLLELNANLQKSENAVELLKERKDLSDEEIKRLRLDNQKHMEEKYQLLDDLRNAQSSMQSGHEATEKTVHNFQNQVHQFESRLKEERERGDKLEEALNKKSQELVSIEEERSRLSSELEGAAAHLRLIGLQKQAVTRELEQVYSSLAELESQLSVSRTENERLRMANANYGDTPSGNLLLGSGLHSRALASSRGIGETTLYNPPSSSALSSSYSRSDIPHQTVKISRRGSVEVVQDSLGSGMEQPSMIPLPSSSGSSATDRGTASTRRGTYYGMYGLNEAQELRQLNRTRSSADVHQYPNFTPSSRYGGGR